MKHTDIALVFDLDNTLVHSTINFARARQRVLEAMLAANGTQDRASLDGLSTAELIEVVRSDAGSPLEDELWKIVGEEETQGMVNASIEEDAPVLLAALRERGVQTAVLTNNARVAAVAALERFQLIEYFDLILARDDVPALKPSPAGLLIARDQFHPASRLAMVGDASIDGLAANRAGLPFIAFRATATDLAARGVDTWRSVKKFEEILGLIAFLPASKM
jgi:phosphoglycolate phosphatase